MLFALQIRQQVMKELEDNFPNDMNSFRRHEFIAENFEAYLYATFSEVEKVANMISNFRKG